MDAKALSRRDPPWQPNPVTSLLNSSGPYGRDGNFTFHIARDISVAHDEHAISGAGRSNLH